MPKKPSNTDFTQLKIHYESNNSIGDIINSIKPSVQICSRLIYFIQNSPIHNEKNRNILFIMNYVDKNLLNKDVGYYHAVMNHLSKLNNDEAMINCIKEMETNKLTVKVSNFQHLITSYYELMKRDNDITYIDKIFDVISMIQERNLAINNETFILLFNVLSTAKTQFNMNIIERFIEVMMYVSQYMDILSQDTYLPLHELINSMNVAESSSFRLGYNDDSHLPHQLSVRSITKDQYSEFKSLWMKHASDSHRALMKKAIKNFKFHNEKFLSPGKPTILIDGANIGYSVNLKRNPSKTTFYRQIDAAVRYFHDKGWNVIIYLYKTHITDYKNDEENKKIIDSWRNVGDNIVRYDVQGLNDDFIWILASFYYNSIRDKTNTYILTNDNMRNHHAIEGLNQKLFFQWRNNHQIRYSIDYTFDEEKGFNDSSFTFNVSMPPEYCHCTHLIMTDEQVTMYVPHTDQNSKKRNERNEAEINYIERFQNNCKSVIWDKIVITIDGP